MAGHATGTRAAMRLVISSSSSVHELIEPLHLVWTQDRANGLLQFALFAVEPFPGVAVNLLDLGAVVVKHLAKLVPLRVVERQFIGEASGDFGRQPRGTGRAARERWREIAASGSAPAREPRTAGRAVERSGWTGKRRHVPAENEAAGAAETKDDEHE